MSALNRKISPQLPSSLRIKHWLLTETSRAPGTHPCPPLQPLPRPHCLCPEHTPHGSLLCPRHLTSQWGCYQHKPTQRLAHFTLFSFPLNRTIVYVCSHFLSSLICLVRYFPTPSTVPGKYQELSKSFLDQELIVLMQLIVCMRENERGDGGGGCG